MHANDVKVGMQVVMSPALHAIIYTVEAFGNIALLSFMQGDQKIEVGYYNPISFNVPTPAQLSFNQVVRTDIQRRMTNVKTKESNDCT